MVSSLETLFFFLDSPKPHRVRFGEQNRFAGMVFDSRGVPITRLRVHTDGRLLAEIAVNLPSQDVSVHLPHLEAAKKCRFDSPVFLAEEVGVLNVEAVEEQGNARHLFDYDLEEIRRSSGRLSAMSRGLEGIPAPPGEIVLLTQGHADSAAYQDSIIPGLLDLERYLGAAGVDWKSIRSVLDFGCGSGRLLAGWSLDDAGRTLSGCDINAQLLGWARRNLPGTIAFDEVSREPPTQYRDASFDVVTAVSVFTHLSRPLQERWVPELRRVLKPGGVLLATFHGIAYIDLFLPDRREEFRAAGHIELERGEEGSNEFTAFHDGSALDGLFRGFEPIAHFPSGRIGGNRLLFPLATFQDVCVFRANAD